MLNLENVIQSASEYAETLKSGGGFTDASYASNGLTAYIKGGKRYILADDAFNAKMDGSFSGEFE